MKTSSFFNRYKEIVLGLVMVVFSLFYVYQASIIKVRSTVAVSAKLIPELLGLLVLVLGVLQMVAGAKALAVVLIADHEEGNKEVFMNAEEKRDVWPILLTFVLIIAYALSFEWLGFVVSSTLCMFFQMMILTPKSAKSPVFFFIISLAVAAVVYVAFRKGLNLSLPQGILEGVLPI